MPTYEERLVWPGSVRNTTDVTRFIALESRSFVVSVSGILRRTDIPNSLPYADTIIANSSEWLANGGSCIAGPDGNWIIAPVQHEEKLIIGIIDHARVMEERQNFDLAGHYSRPDLVQISVNRERQRVVRFTD